MNVYLATDHAGFALKEKIKAFLQEEGHFVDDCGAYALNEQDDYPDFVRSAAEKTAHDNSSIGIILGGSGQGEAIAANKVNGIRCGVFYAPVAPHSAADINGRISNDPYEMVRLLREHNDANMLSLSSRFLNEDEAKAAVKVFLNTKFSGEDRHRRRIAKIKEIQMSE